ncbi:MAG: DNA adenine methylase [Candidatus Cloacimonetes bacterium]|jgi:adenine-specific DNA-methyltransferase|nr:DNA adenine methylase [Candidatus Cloacimonadota bacterium]
MKNDSYEPLFITDEFGGMDHEEAFVKESCKSISSIRSNYVGNKRRILPSVWGISKALGVSTVTDAFGGSGSVSSMFASLGLDVTYNDLLLSSCMQAACLLSESPTMVTEEEWDILTKDPQGESVCSLSRTHYAGKFFTEEEALFLDRYMGNLRTLFPIPKPNSLIYDSTQTPLDHSFMKTIQASCAMIGHINSVCFVGGRYYNGQTLAKKDHRLSHAKNNGVELHRSFYRSISRIPRIEYPRGCSACVYNMDVSELLKKKQSGDLLYLDPPYGGESSDYASLYKFIEEFVTGIRYEDDSEKIKNASKFKGDNGYSDLFKEVLSLSDGYKNWLISFNKTSFANLEEITSIIESFGRSVDVESVSISYNYRKKRRNIVLGELTTGPDGKTRRKNHIVEGTDDELLLLARRAK